jgi:hypothetical protein
MTRAGVSLRPEWQSIGGAKSRRRIAHKGARSPPQVQDEPLLARARRTADSVSPVLAMRLDRNAKAGWCSARAEDLAGWRICCNDSTHT